LVNLPVNGSLGIGTTGPSTYLDVNGGAGEVIDASSGQISAVANADDNDDAINLGQADGRYAPIGSAMPAPGTAGNTLYSNGANWISSPNIYNAGANVGIGTNNPGYLMDVAGNGRVRGNLYVGSGGGYFYNDSGSRVRINQDFYTNNSNTYLYSTNVYLGDSSADNIRVRDNQMYGDDWVINSGGGGNWGIGTTTAPAYRLVVDGDVKTSGNIYVTGELRLGVAADLAERFSAQEEYPAGTVMVVSEGHARSVKPCDSEYDKTVIGVISDNAGIIMGDAGPGGEEVVIAMVGVVGVRVNNGGGSIKKGDMLTTSSVEGEAMKAVESVSGAIIGKALEDMDQGQGYILTLVNLQ
jgi:hypothetical protein